MLQFSGFVVIHLSFVTSAAFVADQAIVRGRIESLDAVKREIKLHTTSGGDVSLTTDARSQFMISGKAATFDQLQRGQRVRVVFERRGTANTLVRLRTAVTSDSDVVREAREALQAAGDYTHQQKDKYEADLRRVIDDVDDRIDDLKARAETVTGEARKDLDRRIEQLRKKRDSLDERLGKIAGASEAAWGEFKACVSSAAKELWGAFERDVPAGK